MYIRSANFASCDVNSIGAQHATKAAWYVTCNSRGCCASETACVEKVTDLCSCSEWLRRTSIVCASVCVCYLLSVCLWATTRLSVTMRAASLNVCVCVCVLVCLAFGANVLGVQCIALCASIVFSLLCFFLCSVYTHTHLTMCAHFACEQSCSYCKQRVVVVHLKWLWTKVYSIGISAWWIWLKRTLIKRVLIKWA